MTIGSPVAKPKRPSSRNRDTWRRLGRPAALTLLLMTYQQPASAEIAIAVAGPATGREAPRAAAALAGARRAAANINAKGGINGEQIAVIAADDGCDAARAGALAAELSQQKVALVLGHPCTAAALAAAKVYGEKNVLFIATSTRHKALTTPRAGATIFRLAGRDDKQGEDAGRYLADAFKGKSIAVVNDRTRYARAVADAAAAALPKSKEGNPITATLIGGEKDFPLVTAKIKSAAAIFYAGFPLEAGMLNAQVRATKSNAVMLLSDSNATREFTDTFGASAQDVRVMLPRFALEDREDEADSASRQLVADGSLAETAVDVFAYAAEETKSIDAVKIAAAISAQAIKTSHGAVSFDALGDAQRPSFDVFTWDGAAWKRAR